MNNLKIQSFLLVIIMALILGCDPLTKSEIINHCDSAIEVILHFDKELLDSTWHSSQSYLEYLNNFGNKINGRNSFDSNNLIATYIINPNDTFLVHGAVGTHPRFIFNKLLVIRESDTIKLEDYGMIYNEFIKIEPRFFEFKITDDKLIKNNN